MRLGRVSNFSVVGSRITEWIDSFAHARPAKSLGMKCGMDRPENITVDLRGNVITCQNVSSASSAINGQPHLGGTVKDLSSVEIKTSTHWSKRDSCPKCPLLQVCRGSCMFLEGPLFWASCENSYSDHLPFFAAAVEIATGYLPYRIEADHLPEDRRSLWEAPQIEPMPVKKTWAIKVEM